MRKPSAGDAPADPARRRLFKAAGATGVATAIPLARVAEAADAPARRAADGARQPYVFLARAEAAFVEAAVARLIPSDGNGPGAIEAGVPAFIDRQLAA